MLLIRRIRISINNGISKLNNELDIVSILNSIRKLDFVIKMIMTEKQVALYEFRKANSISSEIMDNQVKFKKQK